MQAIKQFCIISILALLNAPCLQASAAAKPTMSPAQKALFESLNSSTPNLNEVSSCFVPANPNETADNGETALTMAVAKPNDRVDLLEVLVTNGADVDKPNKQGDTPLHVAAYQGNSKCFERLLLLKANPNIHSAVGLTALHVLVNKATEFYDAKDRDSAIAFIETLVHNSTVHLDATQNTAQGKDTTALCMACDKGNQRAFRLLVRRSDLYIGDPETILSSKLSACKEKATSVRFDLEKSTQNQNETDKFQGMLDMLEIQKEMRLQIISACLEKPDHIGIPAIVAMVMSYCSGNPQKSSNNAILCSVHCDCPNARAKNPAVNHEITPKKLYYAAQ